MQNQLKGRHVVRQTLLTTPLIVKIVRFTPSKLEIFYTVQWGTTTVILNKNLSYNEFIFISVWKYSRFQFKLQNLFQETPFLKVSCSPIIITNGKCFENKFGSSSKHLSRTHILSQKILNWLEICLQDFIEIYRFCKISAFAQLVALNVHRGGKILSLKIFINFAKWRRVATDFLVAQSYFKSKMYQISCCRSFIDLQVCSFPKNIILLWD